MKIAHVSDIHIRNFKYRSEYKAAFEDLYRKLADLGPDLIINTGDTVHSKLSVSPELFDDVAIHLMTMSSIAPHWLILGNHDLNLKNKTRTDAISPIVRALQDKTGFELKLLGDGLQKAGQNFSFWHYDIRGTNHEKWSVDDNEVNIGLYHGSISGCQTDMGFIMEDGETELSLFDKMDYVLLGDIHKRQSFRSGRIQYPGSLIQQNYGEEQVKGFLMWDIRSKTDFNVDFHPVEAPGRFFTIQVPSNFDLSDIDVPKGSRIRAKVEGDITAASRWALEKAIFEKFQPLEVITPESFSEQIRTGVLDIDELIGSREKLMADHLRERGCPDEMAQKVLALFAEYERQTQGDDVATGNTWQLKNFSWDNMMNYGEGNSVDLEKLSGVVGVFAPNASGKSTIFDIMLESLFDRVTKEVPRNVDLVNDNKDSGTMVAEIESGGRRYKIEREIERIHYGQRKLVEVKQWGRTSLNFSSGDEILTGASRPETERTIRKIIGSFEDFSLTSMLSQNPIFGLPGGGDIINCKETDRRKILFRFLGLDLYESINQLCKDEAKSLLGKLKGHDRDALEAEISEARSSSKMTLEAVSTIDEQVKEGLAEEAAIKAELAQIGAENVIRVELEVEKLQGALKTSDAAIEKCKRLFHSQEKTVEEVQSRLQKLTEERPENVSVTLDELACKMGDLTKKRQSLSLSVDQKKTEIARGKISLKTLEDIPCEGKFPTCKFIADASLFLSVRETMEKVLSDLKAEEDAVVTEMIDLEGLQTVSKRFSKWQDDVTRLQLKLGQEKVLLDKQKMELDALIAQHGTIIEKLAERQQVFDTLDSAHVDKLNSSLAAVQKTLKGLASTRDQKVRFLGSLESSINNITKVIDSIDSTKEEAEKFEYLAELTGKTGMPYRILTMVLPVINAEISKILTGVVKFSVFFDENPDDQAVSLFIRYGDYKSRPLGLGSGAEKFIAAIAVRCALLNVSSLPKTDILVIDEGFGKLDPEHLEALHKMFEYLKGAFSTVFVVSHVDSMKDVVDHSIEINTKDGYASVNAP